MKTNKLAKIIGLIGFFLFLSCNDAFEETLLEEPAQHIDAVPKKLSAKRILSDEIRNNPSLNTIIEKSKVFALGKETLESKEVDNGKLGFSIDTDEAMYTTYGDYHSYTFEVFREVPNGLLENLLISLQKDGSYKSWLIAYAFDDSDFESIANDQYIDGIEKRLSVTEIDIDTGTILSSLAATDPCEEEVSRATGWTIQLYSAHCQDGDPATGIGDYGNDSSNDAWGDPNYPGNNDGYNNGGGQAGSGGGSSSGNDGNPSCFDCNGIDYSTLIYGTAHFELINRLGYSYFSTEAVWLRTGENKDIAVEIVNYLNNDSSVKATQFMQWSMELQFLPDVPCGLGHDCVKSIEVMAEGLRKFHGEEGAAMAEMYEAFVSDFDLFTKAELQVFFDAAKSVTQEFNDFMFASITGAFAEGSAKILGVILFEVGGNAAVALLQKIPVSWVLRGATLTPFVQNVARLGIQGTQTHVRIVKVTNPVGRANGLFNALTKNALSKSTQSNGSIVANMGNGNFITYRTTSSSGFPATIDLNFPNLFAVKQVIKFSL